MHRPVGSRALSSAHDPGRGGRHPQHHASICGAAFTQILTPVPFFSAALLKLAASIAATTATPLSIVFKSFLPVIKLRELAALTYPAYTDSAPHVTKPTLVHWHTEDARNAVYAARATETLAQGKSVLVITAREPDIERLSGIFHTNAITVSSEKRRQHVWEAWKQARSGNPIVLIGTRSAIFAPVANLGLIIVDQEHDENLKQEEPNPRYHARTAALALHEMSGADIRLASRVPSIESFYQMQSGAWDYQEVGETRAVTIDLKNLNDAHKHDLFSYLAPDTIVTIGDTLANNQSVFILVDRLGAATVLRCSDCAHEWKCTDCGAFLALYESRQLLRCQRCGFTSAPPDTCPRCHGSAIKHGGAGTERIAKLMTTLQPRWRIIRLDSLTAAATPPRDIDFSMPAVIIGTRFALPYLSRAALGFAVALTADQLLAKPEFAAHEDTYRMLSDLAHRSGTLCIYTREVAHPVLQALTKPYRAFYNEEVVMRKRWQYPPYAVLIRLILQNPVRATLSRTAAGVARKLKTALPDLRVSDPYDLQPARVRGRWRTGILLKCHDIEAAATLPWTRIIDASTIVDVQPKSIM